MQKVIGFIVCVSVMTVSLYFFSGADPSRSLSAQTESSDMDSYGSVARRFMNDARQLAKQGNVQEARRLAETAASLSGKWKEGEQTPQQFLSTLDSGDASKANPFQQDGKSQWPSLENSKTPLSLKAAPFAADEAEPLPKGAGVDILNRRKAQQLMKEARAALNDGDIAVARARAMQARTFKVSWGLWDERPDHLLAEIDRADGATTFLADDKSTATARPKDAEATYQKAKSLLVQAREAIKASKLQQAADLTKQAEALDATYTLWEDSPALVKRDLQQLVQGGAAPSMMFDAPKQKMSPNENLAHELLKEARAAYAQGQLAIAKEKAERAQNMNVTFSLLGDRPELLLSDVERALNGQSLRQNDNADAIAAFGGPLDMTPQSETPQSANPFQFQSNVLPVSGTPGDEEYPVVQSGGPSAEDTIDLGISLLQSGEMQAGHEALQQAWQHADQLDPAKREYLQGVLLQLSGATQVAAVSDSETQNVAAETTSPQEQPELSTPDVLKEAANAHDVQFTRLRTEVLNSMFRAEKLKDQNPDEALEVLDRTLASIESTDLPEESARVLVGHVERSRKSIETYMEQRAPIIAMESRNRDVKEQIERQVENQIRIEQEFADLVEQYNDLKRQRRYAEAELVAKKAKDLNPNLPQAVIMVEQAKLQRQIHHIETVKEKKADYALDALNKVDIAMGAPTGDYNLMDPKSWAELSARRSKYGSASARTRTESEQKIEDSLGQQISLHFHDVPLTDIIRHIATTHGINIALDTRAIETEGQRVDQNVSIDVDGISLRSALNLLLDQVGGLVYDIQDEVLKITNRHEKESTFRVDVYNVADLVVPMNLNRAPGTYDNLIATNSRNSGGMFQIDDDLTVGINGNGMSRGGGSGNRDSNGGADFSGLMDLITTTIEPGTWAIDGGAGRLEGSENTLSLVIRQTPAVHEQIVELLGQLRKLQDLQVTVEVRFISVTDRFFERIGVDFDFNVQDSLGDPPGTPAFGSRQLQFPGGAGGAGGGAGGAGGAGDLRGGQAGAGGGGGVGQQGGQQGQQGQQGGGLGLFDSIQRVNAPRDDFKRTTVGLQSPDSFTEDYDIQFRQGSFEIGVPDFGNFNPDAGIQVGMAILSDIEAFFFIQAAQADERANVLFAPKVTLFNGQQANITDSTERPFVIGLIPVVGTGAVGFQPIIQPITDGITLDVLAVISADRRFVRLSLNPSFNNIVDVFTFSFASGGAGGGAIGGGGGGGVGGGGGGGIGGGGGGGGFGGGQVGGGGIGGGGGGGGVGGGGAGGQAGGQQGQQGQQAGGGGGTLTVQQPVQEIINVSTIVSVPDGGTVLLGGIKRLREGRNMAGVPILNKIPYVSRLFKNSGVGRETESVMLMVTPRIIIHEEEEELILGTSGL